MKLSLKTSIILLVFVSMTSCFTSKKSGDQSLRIHPLSETSGMREGTLVYALPRTVFTVIAEFEKVVKKPGPYAVYAADYLGVDDAILQESVTWSITSVKLVSHQEIDPSEFYVIESSSVFGSNALALKKEGLILDLNPELFNQLSNENVGSKNESSSPASFDMGSDEYFQIQRDTMYKRVAVDSSFVRIPYIVEKKKKLTPEQLAERAARRLLELRDGKHLILTGEATVFPQNEAPINEINKMEKDYTELFTGKTFGEKKIFTFNIIPEKEKDTKPLILFYLSRVSGPVGKASGNAVAVNVEFLPENKTKDLTIISNNTSDPVVPSWDKLFYRVPDIVNVKISMGDAVLLSTRRMIFQYGSVIQLPSNFIIGKE